MSYDNEFYKAPENQDSVERESNLYPQYSYNERPRKKRHKRSGFFTIVVVALISAMIGGLITAYIAPNYLYGKYIEVPEIYGGQQQNIEIIPKNEELNVISAVAKKAMPAVVGITTVSVQQDFFFGPTRSQGVGTGVIVDSKGYILTNSHVVDNGEAEEVKVLLYNGKTLKAQVLWNDPVLDLAVVKVEARNLPVADLGDSDELIVGETAIAIGNPLGLTFERSVTAGIISGLNRSIQINEYESIDGLIQTDASINPGNSGGPLLNSEGEVIGINTAKIKTAEGLGFAIPINIAKPIVDEFIEKGEFTKVQLGIRGIDARDFVRTYGDNLGTKTGVFVYQVSPGSAANKAGLQGGDVIVGMGGKKIDSMRKLIRELYKYRPGDETTLEIIRNKEKMEVTVRFESKTYK
jgi:S1-C subfamily serine protease